MNGLLLVNLGTPDAPDTKSVRRYLRQFLADPRVLDIHPLGRWLLLNLIILPLRPRRSAAAYRQIWSERGSPLLYHGVDLAAKVAARLGDGWRVELAMRYGRPSIKAALAKLDSARIDRLVVLPLYPQYAAASTGSSVEEVLRVAGRRWVTPTLQIVEPFYDHPGFLDAFARRGRPIFEAERADHVLFSFHGLPERHMRKSDPTGRHCFSAGCCDRLVTANRDCYRAQCFATARLLAARLGLDEAGYSVSFQSRLGRTPWIKPYTDQVLPELLAQGRRRIVVFSPAFVADCLETIEEIGLRARQDFLARGGESLTLVPSLNAGDDWAAVVVELVARQSDRYRRGLPVVADDGSAA